VWKISPPTGGFFVLSCALYFICTYFFVLMVPRFAFCLYWQHITQISMHPAGFEPRNPASDRPQTLRPLGYWDSIPGLSSLQRVTIPSTLILPTLQTSAHADCSHTLFAHCRFLALGTRSVDVPEHSFYVYYVIRLCINHVMRLDYASLGRAELCDNGD
jgi:hypothetical protein